MEEKTGHSRQASTSKRSKRVTAKRPTTSKTKRKRGRAATKPFPINTFESVLPLAKAIFDNAGASHEMRRLTIFDKLGKGPDSGPSRMLITNSGKYGLTEGGYQAEHLKLTPQSLLVLDQSATRADATRAKFELAIRKIPAFNGLYQKYKDGKLPASEVMKDQLGEFTIPAEDRQACVNIFIENAKHVGLLKVLSDAERLLSVDHILEELDGERKASLTLDQKVVASTASENGSQSTTDFDSVCFFIAPIGDQDSPERKHSDMVYSTLVERAVEPMKLKVIRADKITSPGMISKQVIEYILKSRIVIVDMSFHNPNVFYELALRHTIGKSTVHLIRRRDKVPFDLGNFRTITIDDSDMYDLIAKLDTYRAEIANQVQQALQTMEEEATSDNPILTFFPGLKITFPNE